ncbi:MAG: phytanoyl-CoA dioxygenase family protein [Gammaproteobacteria bacterium]
MSLAPSPDFASALATLDAEGVAILPGALSAAQTADVRRRLFDACSASEADGVPTRGYAFDPDRHNRRVFHLFNLDPVFVDLVQRPLALDFVRHLLGEDFLVSNFSANITAPGSARMQLHADQGYIPPPWPDHPYACNVAWLLDDLTEENGGTRYVPGSHRRGHGPAPGTPCDTVAIVAPAGSVLVMDGRLWHQTGANRSAASERAVLFGYYVLRWLRPQVSWNTMLWPETIATLEPRFLHLLGYYTGNVEFQVPHGRRAAAPPPPGLDAGATAFALGIRERRG